MRELKTTKTHRHAAKKKKKKSIARVVSDVVVRKNF